MIGFSRFAKDSRYLLAGDVSPVYILPGIYGDKSGLVEFRSRLVGRIPVEIIEIQSLEEPLADLLDMKAVGTAVAREINRRSPEGSLRLAGYSFGGSVAFEAARYLVASGRNVCFLGLIDVRRPRQLAQDAQRGWLDERLLPLLRTIHSTANLPFSIFRYRVVEKLLGRFCSSDFRLRFVLSMTMHFWPSRVRTVRRMLLHDLRGQTMESWHPVPMPGAVFLAISQEYSHSIDEWKVLCPQGNVIELPGVHTQVFESPSLDILLSAFEKFALLPSSIDPKHHFDPNGSNLHR
jgi:thioesterase domain-containing protein